MFASLPMYDRPSTRAGYAQLWVGIRDNLRDVGIDAPEALDYDTAEMAGWRRDDLVLGQICNLPYRAIFQGKVTRIGAADYGLDGCEAGFYRSVLIAHKENAAEIEALAKGPFAANGLGSHSGYGSPQAWAKERGFLFPSPILTGSHDRSLQSVAAKQAAIASIDAQTWVHQQRDMPEAKDVRVVAWTKPSPGMTFITKGDVNPVPYQDAIAAAIANLSADMRGVLGLKGVIALPDEAYALPMPPLPSQIDA